MIIDTNLQLSDAQECLSTANSESVIDFQVANPNLGVGTPLWLHVKVNTAFASTGSTSIGGYYQFTDCATSGGTYDVIWRTADKQLSIYVAGYDILTIPLPNQHKEFLRGTWVSSGVSCSAGKIDAFLAAAGPRA